MCGNYNSVMGFNKKIFLKKLLKEKVEKLSNEKIFLLSGVIVYCNSSNGLAKKIDSFIFGGSLKKFWLID